MVLGTSAPAVAAPGDVAAPQVPASTAEEYIVAFHGAPEAAAAAIAAAGGTVTDLTEQVGVALVTSTDGAFLDDVRARGEIRGAARNHSVGTARPGMPHRFAEERPVADRAGGSGSPDRPSDGGPGAEPLADRQWNMQM